MAALAVTLATILIAHTYFVFYQTFDEPAHIACGMEWLDRGTYLYEALHPPLARVATAILPYLYGSRDLGIPDMWKEGNGILEYGGSYQRTLTLARLGILPFFWLTCFLVWRFMRVRFGDWYAVVALVLLAFCPVVLGHSSVATTDTPLMAMYLWSLMALLKLLESPRWQYAALAGVLIALAVATKFTEMPFLLVGGGILVLFFWLRQRRFPVPLRLAGLAFCIGVVVLWAVYRFSFGPILRPEALTENTLHRLAVMASWKRHLLLSPHMPMDRFFFGLAEAFVTGAHGRLSYALGHTYTGGKWYFFPLAILAKTPISLLLLAAAGIVALLWRGEIKKDPRAVFLLCGLLGPLAVAIPSHVNIGVRHVLPIYPFLAMLGAIAVVRWWKAETRKAWLYRIIIILLVGWNIETCLGTSPDFIAYFNEIAEPHASYLLIDSDLDWGQDLRRLDLRLAELNAREVWLQYHGTADSVKLFPTNWRPLDPHDRPTGWVAISENDFRENPDFDWLTSFPYERVGRSIRLYHLTDSNPHP
jgi:4-amino-4-deoxy-L-arabinose transferase-like glycosyltransferase